jgi:hypothetical protein
MGFMALGQSTILNHAVKDNIVIMARGANYLLAGIPHALRVRAEAPVEKRIEWLMRRESLDKASATHLVNRNDSETASVIRQLYGKKWDDPEAYEIKFDTSAQRLEEIVEIVKNLLKSKDALKTPEAQSLLRQRALAARIKAKLLVNPAFCASTLEMETKGNGILLRGVVCGAAEQKEIEKEVLEIAGSVPLICELKCQRIAIKKQGKYQNEPGVRE